MKEPVPEAKRLLETLEYFETFEPKLTPWWTSAIWGGAATAAVMATAAVVGPGAALVAIGLLLGAVAAQSR